MRKVVYISGPITQGDRNKSFYLAAKAHRELIDAGFAPINPILTMLLPFAWEPAYPHSTWMECDLPLVERADAVYRLPGVSDGADLEVAHAQSRHIPVFFLMDELISEMKLRS